MTDERRWTIDVCTGCGCTWLEEDGKSKFCSLHPPLPGQPDYEAIEVVPAATLDHYKAELERVRELARTAAQEERDALFGFFDDDEYPEAQIRFKLAYETRERQAAERTIEQLRGALEEIRDFWRDGIDPRREVHILKRCAEAVLSDSKEQGQ